uniref:RNase H type-1 domain-containing protein n=1 Tax=Fagus sylvatica TaxID=28930 RepID=A0A2N9H2E3_FAGSY
MFTTAWGLWQARNSFFWEEKMSSVEDICQKSVGIAMDFLETCIDVQKEGGIIEIMGASRWRPPEEGTFKVNIASCTFTLKITGDILQFVAMAVVEAIRFAIDIGLLRVELEFDNKDLFWLLKQVGPCLAPVGNLCLGYRGCVLIVFLGVVGRLP